MIVNAGMFGMQSVPSLFPKGPNYDIQVSPNFNLFPVNPQHFLPPNVPFHHPQHLILKGMMPPVITTSHHLTPTAHLISTHPLHLTSKAKHPTTNTHSNPQRVSVTNFTSDRVSPPDNCPKPAPVRLFRPWVEESPKKISSETSSEEPKTSSEESKKFVPRSTHSQNSAVELVPDEHQSALEQLATNLGKSSTGHQCIYCGKVYSRKYGLKIHLRTHTGFKPLQCKVCKRAFGDPSNLNKHTRLHAENGLAFKCHLCGKLLIRRRDLDRHLISRHGVGQETAHGQTGLSSDESCSLEGDDLRID